MAIKFTNIRSGEEKLASTEPMIAAYYNSGNTHPNALGGQDFGWRLAPETIKRMRDIKANPQTLNTIAAMSNIMLEDIKDSHILFFISEQDKRAQGAEAEQKETVHSKRYEEQLRELDEETTPASSQNTEETNTGNDTIEAPETSGDEINQEKSDAQ